jgi:hypothetical protein
MLAAAAAKGRRTGSTMTTTFEDRERGFEAKFAHDEELRFLALARRDKLFALWVVTELGLAGADRSHLIAGLLAVQGFPHHDEALLARATTALAAAGHAIAAGAIAAALARIGKEARQQLMQGDATQIDLGELPATR